jgi:hypothetical protein
VSDLTPADEARLAVVNAALTCVAYVHATDEDAQAADDALDLAAIRLVSELEAERAR